MNPPGCATTASGSRFLWAIIGSANSTSVATSGWTSASGPNASAAARIPERQDGYCHPAQPPALVS